MVKNEKGNDHVTCKKAKINETENNKLRDWRSITMKAKLENLSINQKAKEMDKKNLMDKSNDDKSLLIIDIYQAAFLALKQIEPVLRKDGTRIIFEFPGTGLVLEKLRMYNLNPSLKVLDFVAQVRRLRAQMLSMRGSSH